MESQSKTTMRCSSHKMDHVLFVVGALARDILPVTTTTRLARYVGYSAQLAIKFLRQYEIAKKDYTMQQITSQVLLHEEYWMNETGQDTPIREQCGFGYHRPDCKDRPDRKETGEPT